MPHFQKLYERLKNRSDILVVTITKDDELGLVEPFMKQNKYTFPVLLAKDLADQIGSPGIPTNWMLDPSATMRYESIGFSPSWSGEKWMSIAAETMGKIIGKAVELAPATE